MRVIASGWGRDHGVKEIIETPLADVPAKDEIDSYYMGETYLQTVGTTKDSRLPFGGVRVSAGAKLNLCGRYLVRVELSRSEIARLFELTHGDQHAELSPMEVARLFYQTYGDQELGDIVRLFASFKNEGEQGASRASRKARS
jgi:hypothetical protein